MTSLEKSTTSAHTIHKFEICALLLFSLIQEKKQRLITEVGWIDIVPFIDDSIIARKDFIRSSCICKIEQSFNYPM